MSQKMKIQYSWQWISFISFFCFLAIFSCISNFGFADVTTLLRIVYKNWWCSAVMWKLIQAYTKNKQIKNKPEWIDKT